MASNSRRTYSSGGDSATMETPYVVDLEQNAAEEAHLRNTTVRDMAWTGITVTVKDRVTKKPKVLLDNIEGYVEAGKPPPPHHSFLSPQFPPCPLERVNAAERKDW